MNSGRTRLENCQRGPTESRLFCLSVKVDGGTRLGEPSYVGRLSESPIYIAFLKRDLMISAIEIVHRVNSDHDQHILL